jgi:Gram-negative porin
MDMFGGLTKTSSRIAIAAALGLALGGFAFKATPAKAADLGGDCCADLEERVAELEATTVRKGNKKVSVTLSGWVVKSFNWWDDGDIDSAFVGDKGYDLGSRFAITGSATIAPGWSGGFNITVNTYGDIFGDAGVGAASNQFDEAGGTFGNISTLYSYIYIKSDKWGTLNWGHLSPASDNPAVLADISGTVIESNAVFFEGASFILRPKGAKLGGYGGLDNGLAWEDFLLCQGLGLGIGADCFGAAMPAVRYDSPTWGGFRFETSWGKQSLTSGSESFPTPEFNFWDIAAFYTADWNSIKLSAAYAFTWQESSIIGGSFSPGFCDFDFGPFSNCFGDSSTLNDSKLHQIGASIMHKPSGLGIYATGNWEDVSGDANRCLGNLGGSSTLCLNALSFSALPDTDMWGVKPFWRKAWSPIGATVLYAEFAQYNDYFGLGNINGLASVVPNCTTGVCTITGSEVERWGLGVVQEIDSAAMHVWLRWQHNKADIDILQVDGTRTGQSFEDQDLIQAGGIIFF